jgi:TonB-dependent receptor
MKQIFLTLCFVVCFSILSFSQGTLKGKIVDEHNETVVGATILIKSTTIGVTTDLDGNYSLKIPDASKKTIVITFISYKTIEFELTVKNNETVIKDFKLENDTKTLGAVEVVGKSSRAKEYYMENMKMKSSVSLDYISSETMKKTGDANITAAVARVSGVSTSNNGLITVRGAGDRFIKTNMNGSRIPTLDPLTNNLKLDMFPSGLVDNVILVKTASPDLPGDWAAAYISVETKDYPDNLQVNVETAVAYNSQSTFKDYLSSEKSSTDWMGFDNGYRQHDHEKNPTADQATGQEYLQTNSENRYYEFVALGLGNYFSSMGITYQNYNANKDQYTKLALVELGFLPKAQINDKAAYIKAQNDYLASGARQKAYAINNQRFEDDNLSFKNNWNTVKRKAPLNFSQTFSVGNKVKLFNRDLGILFGLRYNSSVASDPNAVGINDITYDAPIGIKVAQPTIQQVSRETNGWNTLLNATYKLNKNNSIGLLFMPNMTGINNVRYSEIDIKDPGQPNFYKFRKDQFYESRRQLIYQLKTEHYLPASRIKIDANASYTKGKNDAPDFKRLPYRGVKDPVTGEVYALEIGGGDQLLQRNYRVLTEDVLDTKIALELPFANQEEGKSKGKIKVGGAYQYTKRKNDRYCYTLNMGIPIDSSVTDDRIGVFFEPDFLKINYFTNTTSGNPYPDAQLSSYYARNNIPVNNTFGKSSVAGAFIMADYNFLKHLRASGGVRVEQFNALADVFLYDSLHYKNDDPRRKYQAENQVWFLANGAYRKELDYLPSLNLIYQLNDNDEKPINIRLNYSKTVARPSLRELLDVCYFDYEFNNDVKGNPDLKTVKIDNYDVRFESYFKSGDNISASLFYKEMIDMVQLIAVQQVGFTWFNSPKKSNVQGIELEGKKKLTKHLDLMANITLVKSTSYIYSSYSRTQSIGDEPEAIVFGDNIIKRPLFGQAPYVINTILSYNSDSLGLGVAVSYNVQGPKLSVMAPFSFNYDIYELPRHLIDFKISKTLSKHFSMSLNIKDLLNAPIVRAAKYQDKKGFYKDVYYDKYRFGSIYQLSLTYKI